MQRRQVPSFLSSRKSYSARWAFSFWYAALAIAGITIQGCSKATRASARDQAKVPVSAATAVLKTLPVEVDAIGNAEAINSVAIRSLVSGEIAQVYFTEGQVVKKGQTLFLIDSRPYQVEVDRAQANLVKDAAQLNQAKANLARDMAQQKYNDGQAKRFAELLAQGVIPKSQYDQVQSSAEVSAETLHADQAAIDSVQASVEADKATLERAKFDLGNCTIVSPMEGRSGALMVQQGNLIKANDVPLTVINQIQPIYVDFSLPERYLSEIRRYAADGKLVASANSQDASAPPETGSLDFIDNAVDMATGTIKLKGLFQNANQKLWPGEFVNISLQLTTLPNAVVVPIDAIQTGQDGQFTFVVKPDMTAEMRPVSTGIQVGQEVAVQKGLQPGEVVVTEGQLRIVPGVQVKIQNPGQTVGASQEQPGPKD
jgi:membrane fusion protein, multidrug efflux system